MKKQKCCGRRSESGSRKKKKRSEKKSAPNREKGTNSANKMTQQKPEPGAPCSDTRDNMPEVCNTIHTRNAESRDK